MNGLAGNTLTKIITKKINWQKFGQSVPNLCFHTFSMNAIVCHTIVYKYEIVSVCFKRLLRFEKFPPPTAPAPAPSPSPASSLTKQDSLKALLLRSECLMIIFLFNLLFKIKVELSSGQVHLP